MRLLIFVPSFNDQLGLPELILQINATYPQATVLVLDDGSSPPLTLPNTLPFNGLSVVLHRLPFNVGLGLATSVALDYFLDGPFDYLVRVDADGQHPVEEIEELVMPLRGGFADVVWGERINHLKIGSIKQLTGALTKQSTALMGQLIFRSKLRDWYSGFFALDREAALLVSGVHLERYCEVQMLCIFHTSKLKVLTHRITQMDRLFGSSRIGWFDGLMILFRSTLMMFMYALRMHPK